MSAQENEGEAVRTTIVGGRPAGSGRGIGTIPRGVEVLLKKAAVDAEFRELLFEQRGHAAEAIGLDLDAAESAMLKAIPREQLEYIVAQTLVPVEQRRVFLGRLAAPMLALLGVVVTGCPAKSKGMESDRPGPQLAKAQSATPVFSLMGTQPDLPEQNVTNLPAPAPAGIRPDAPRTNQPPAQTPPITPPATNQPVSPATRGTRPDRS